MKSFKDLSYLEGQELVFKRGLSQLTELDCTRVPDKCIFLKDYEKTVLLDFIYIYDECGLVKPPRHFKKMIPKSAMFVGDVLLIGNTKLIGSEVFG